MKTASVHLTSAWMGTYASIVLLFTAGAFALTSCSRKAIPPVAATAIAPTDIASNTPATPSVASQPIYTPPADPAPAIAVAAGGGASLRDLNHIYFSWVGRTHRRATTYEEFIGASGIQVPPPPAGKKYVIDHNGFINLVSR